MGAVSPAYGKKADYRDDAEVPEVSAEVPESPQTTSAWMPDWRAIAVPAHDGKRSEMGGGAGELGKARKRAPGARGRRGQRFIRSALAGRVRGTFERVHAARKIIQDAGLDVREFALIGLTLLQAWGGQMQIQSGANPDSLARAAGINPANLRFAKQHEAELRQLIQRVSTN